MRTHPLVLVASVVAAASLANAQVDILYTNSSSTAGNYADCVVLWTPAGQRPFAQESHGRTATGSVRKMKGRTVGGVNYLYWYDIITDDLWRGCDLNGNGVIDPTEFQLVFDQPVSSDGSIDEGGGVWWNGIGATAIGELWRLQDTNNDGDFMDAGESTQVVAGPTITLVNPAIAGVSSNNVTGVVMMANGDCVWYPKGTAALPTHALIRTTPAGVSSLFMAPVFASIVRSPVLPTNPDFGTTLPPSIGTNALDRVAVDSVNDAVFAAVNFTVAVPQPWIFRCKDGNADGDANDSGEVTMFYNGTTGPVAMTSIDDIEWLNGKLYVSHEVNPNAGANQFVELVDLNNDGDAMDAGEQAILGGTSAAPLDDPTVIGISAVPSGFFTGPGCVGADLRDNGMAAAGGTLTLTFGDIPLALQAPTTFCIGLLSLTGDGPLPLPGGCILGLSFDALTNAALPFMIGSGPIARSFAVPSLPYPPLPIGTRVYAAGVILDLNLSAFAPVTHSVVIRVQ